MEESRRGCREVGNRYDELWTLYELGFLYDYLGMLEKIEGDFTEAVDVSRRLENNYQACSHLYSLGILFFWRGDFEHSESLFRQAIEVVCLEKNNDYYESWINLFLGMIKVETGCLQEAEECYARAQNIFLRTSSFPPEALSSMANLKMVQGKQEEALQLVERMLPFPEPMMAFNEEPSTFCRLAAYKVLLANHDPRAEGILLEMIRIISNNADAIEDPEQRQAFLTKAPLNREFLEIYEKSRALVNVEPKFT
jgi:tetratricopeptide (TPR) repeat protein